MDYPRTATQGTETPVSLYEAIGQLSEVSWQLNGFVFGEMPPKQPEAKLAAGDKISEARNQIQDITNRLREVKNRLSMIG